MASPVRLHLEHGRVPQRLVGLEHEQRRPHQAHLAYQARGQAFQSLVGSAYQAEQQARLEDQLASHLAGQPEQQALRGQYSGGQQA